MNPICEPSPYLDKWLERIRTEPAVRATLPESALLVLELYEREQSARPRKFSLQWRRRAQCLAPATKRPGTPPPPLLIFPSSQAK